MSAGSSILVGVNEGQALVKVAGKGSFLNASGLKNFSKKMLADGCRAFVIDLGGCAGMDSTFMGTLAGMALRLREIGGGTLEIVNITERNYDSLRNLGLDALFEITEESGDPPTAPMAEVAGRNPTAEGMLEAHRALGDADPMNLVRFKDVLEFLEGDVGGEGTDRQP